MMMHHSSQNYEDAATDAAAEAREKMERVIETGRASAAAVYEKIHREVPADAYGKMGAMRFGYAAAGSFAHVDQPEVLDADDPRAAGLDGADDVGRILGMVETGEAPEAPEKPEEEPESEARTLVLKVAEKTLGVHRHSMQQMAQTAGVDTRYLRRLVGSDNESLRELALEILHTHFGRTDLGEQYRLMRSVDGELRGFLSDRYRRIDSRPLLETFAEACQAIGAVPVDGIGTDLRVQLKAYLPIIFEPIPNEPMMVGLAWHNSDFGCGSHGLAMTILRLWCTNRATSEQSFRQVHAGGRLASDVSYREETLRLDTAANQAKLHDEVSHLLGPKAVGETMGKIKKANAESCDWQDFESRLKKLLSKSENDAAEQAFNGDDVINLPAEKTVWRASNAISWIAGNAPAERRIELERLAGALYAGEKRLPVAA